MMFVLRIAGWIALLVAPIAIYWFIIRPRLGAGMTDIYAHIDGFWARLWARVKAFQTFLVSALGVYVVAIPGLLDGLQAMDFSFLPQPWPGYVGATVAIAQLLLRAYSTTPAGLPPSGEA
jgi:hypothetical protein